MSAQLSTIPAVAEIIGRALALGWTLERVTDLCAVIPPSLDLSIATVWYSRASESDAPVRHVTPAVTVDVSADSITLTGPNSRWRAYRSLEAYPVIAPRAPRAHRTDAGDASDASDAIGAPPPPAGDSWRRMHDPEPTALIGCTPWGAHALSLGWPECEVYKLERGLGVTEIVGVSPERIAIRNPFTGDARSVLRSEAEEWPDGSEPTYAPEPPPRQIVELDVCDCIGRARLGIGHHLRSCELWAPVTAVTAVAADHATHATHATPAKRNGNRRGAPSAQTLDLLSSAQPWPAQIIVVDTETTGISRDARIIEIAAARVDTSAGPSEPSAWRVVDTWVRLVNPGIPIPAAASAVNRIYDRDVRDQPGADVVLPEFLAWVGDAPLVAHNAPFDAKRIAFEVARAGILLPNTLRVFCSLAAARRRWPEAQNHKLGTLATWLRLPAAPTHRALADVLATVELLRVAVVKDGAEPPAHLGVLCGEPELVTGSQAKTLF